MENNEFSSAITAEFLEEYKKLEIIEETDPDRFNHFRNKHVSFFELFRQARNCLTHTPKLSGDYPFLISRETLTLLQDMVTKMSVKAYEVAIKISQVETISLEQPLQEAFTLMSTKNYSYLPIFDDKKRLALVISEKSILNILGDQNRCIVYDQNTLLKYFQSYFAVDANPDEYYDFLGRNAFAYQAKNRFAEIRNGKKCGAIFVTENGSPSEAVLGIITLWEVLDH